MGPGEAVLSLLRGGVELLRDTPWPILAAVAFAVLLFSVVSLYVALSLVAPRPRASYDSETQFKTILPDGKVSESKALPCWVEKWKKVPGEPVDDAEIFMSVVVPAFNEEERLSGMLEEAVAFLQEAYGDAHGSETEEKQPSRSATKRKSSINKGQQNGSANGGASEHIGNGWEILVVSDGSTDKTVETALNFARDHQLSEYPVPVPGPRTPKPTRSTHIPHGSIRVIELAENRGKGGAVTHGMRHVRGQYVVFADADGASRFEDLAALVRGCQKLEDSQGRGVAIGSRAHLVGSEAVVKRSALRNFLMHSFHLLLRLMTPPATSRIRDTQCGFKLFSRASLPDIVPYMHSEGWIFDVEMLMLAESANIPVAEIAIGWKEVKGSKLNVIRDSINMAWGLAVLRLAWALGVYRRR